MCGVADGQHPDIIADGQQRYLALVNGNWLTGVFYTTPANTLKFGAQTGSLIPLRAPHYYGWPQWHALFVITNEKSIRDQATTTRYFARAFAGRE